MLEPALARQCQHIVLELDVDVGLSQARKIGAQHEVVVGLDEVHRRNPPAQRGAVGRGRRIEECVEETVHLALNRVQLADRLPADECHITSLEAVGTVVSHSMKSKWLAVKSEL